MTNSLKAIITNDGSMTLHSSQFEATYHSHHGALQESRHVFIQNGLASKNENNQLNVLELGFGTGLNASLSLDYALKNRQKLRYHTIEKFPISIETFEHLNFSDFLDDNIYNALVLMHQSAWNKKIIIDDHFEFMKTNTDFNDYYNDMVYDVVFHDAFAPSTQSQFWEAPFLQHIYQLMAEGGILVTFCAKGSFKRALKSVGFQLESLEGPPGKREMTRAHKKSFS